MSTAIVRQQDAATATFGDVQRIAEMFALSNYFDAKGNTPVAVAQIITKIMAGRELGYGPFASVNGIHVIQGRTALGANLMAAAVKASGRYDYRVKRMDADACELEFFERVDGKRELLGVSSFTKQDAAAAKTQNMDKFGRNMMFARAMSNGVKWFCPDVFNGSTVYVPEELGAEVDGEGNVIDTTARVIVEQPQAQPEPDAETTFKAFMAEGNKAFGDYWKPARHWLIERYTTRYTPDNIRFSSKELTPAEVAQLTADIKKYNGKLVAQWNEYKAKVDAELDAITVNGSPEMVPA